MAINTDDESLEDTATQVQSNRKPLKLVLSYPWMSPLFALLVVAVHIIFGYTPELQSHALYGINVSVIVQATLVCLVLLFVGADIRRFLTQIKRNQDRVSALEEELAFAWENRKKLQKRTHLYYDHADKLKQFISDKLIEQIEYDEKFLHFKSIAAEIRHNGVISYDIVRSALEKAVKDHGERVQADLNLSDTHRFGLPNNPNSGYQQALQAMKYLWDLLDLSTADNISLHIGNFLIDCEEEYYQWELNKTKAGTDSSGTAPIFLPAYATVKAMAPFLPEDKLADSILPYAQANTSGAPSAAAIQQNAQFRIQLQKTDHLLGNENHFILLVENLVKNAQFFSSKVAFKQATDRIGLRLLQQNHLIEVSVYNRGPLISEEDKEHIFKMGYTTRRTKDHHGKGLGLFFVNEIVKGYQGCVNIKNIHNAESTYTVRIALKKKEVLTKVLERRIYNDRPQVKELDGSGLVNAVRWRLDAPILSIEVSSSRDNRTHIFSDLADGPTQLLDPSSPFMPEWLLDIHSEKNVYSVVFSALDVMGVNFIVRLPTAEARLSGEDIEAMNQTNGLF